VSGETVEKRDAREDLAGVGCSDDFGLDARRREEKVDDHAAGWSWWRFEADGREARDASLMELEGEPKVLDEMLRVCSSPRTRTRSCRSRRSEWQKGQ
jgi:hypothetical protein